MIGNWLPELRTGDIVRILDPLRVQVREATPTEVGTCLARDLPTDVEVPVGTEARVERGEGRWSEGLIELHFSLPGFPPFSKHWTEYDRGMSRLVKVRDVEDIRMTYGLPFPEG